MANTTNLNLVKPSGTDYALVSVINGNMDIIDSKVGAIPANESAQSQITALNNHLTKFHFYNTTINSNIHTGEGSLFRSAAKSLSINSSNVVFASVSVISNSAVWAKITQIESNKIYYMLQSATDISESQDFNVLVMTVDA